MLAYYSHELLKFRCISITVQRPGVSPQRSQVFDMHGVHAILCGPRFYESGIIGSRLWRCWPSILNGLCVQAVGELSRQIERRLQAERPMGPAGARAGLSGVIFVASGITRPRWSSGCGLVTACGFRIHGSARGGTTRPRACFSNSRAMWCTTDGKLLELNPCWRLKDLAAHAARWPSVFGLSVAFLLV